MLPEPDFQGPGAPSDDPAAEGAGNINNRCGMCTPGKMSFIFRRPYEGGCGKVSDVLFHVQPLGFEGMDELLDVLPSPGLEVHDDLDISHGDIGEGPPVVDFQHVRADLRGDPGEKREVPGSIRHADP